MSNPTHDAVAFDSSPLTRLEDAALRPGFWGCKIESLSVPGPEKPDQGCGWEGPGPEDAGEGESIGKRFALIDKGVHLALTMPKSVFSWEILEAREREPVTPLAPGSTWESPGSLSRPPW